MNDFFQLLLLAIVQGLTEFLPVSSSAHLNIIPIIANWQQQPQIINVAIHFGSLIAVMTYLHRQMWQVATGVLDIVKKIKSEQSILAKNIIIASIPVTLLGAVLLTIDIIDDLRTLTVIAIVNLICALLLWYSDKCDQSLTIISKRHAWQIGLAQALAVIPGVSRSGITMTMARYLGIKRADAARFSLLMAIPVIVLATIAELAKASLFAKTIDGEAVIISMVLSFIAAYFSIAFMLRILQRFGFMPFVIYRLLLSVFLLAIVISSL